MTSIRLDATELHELFAEPTPSGVWLRVEQLTGTPSGFPEVTVSGARDAVRAFVRDNWGDDLVRDADEGGWWSDKSRFIAGPPVIVPKDATRKEQLELGYPVVPPAPGTRTREEWAALGCRTRRQP